MFIDDYSTLHSLSNSLGLHRSHKSGTIGSMFPDSRQDLEAIRAHFVVFCQLVGPDVRAQWLEGKHQSRRTLRLFSI